MRRLTRDLVMAVAGFLAFPVALFCLALCVDERHYDLFDRQGRGW